MDIKQRIQDFIKYKGISVKKFEELCKLSNGYISSMRKGFGADKLSNVLNVFPELNREWLLYGEGEMLRAETQEDKNPLVHGQITEEKSLIPLLPTSAQGGSLNDFVISVKGSDCEKVLSPIKGADFALPVAGDSMAPEYPNGSQIHVKKINEQAFIEWGKVYVLDTCNGVVIKQIVPSDKEGYVKCLSINPDPIFAPFEVCLNDVYGIYRVLLCLSIK